ncbi:hypothetical protein V5O48_010715 [Marasmius crinis-equi]|uniref:F-box domain-containing protein n=1 Tax=Marasmius crinis-equi TaxID=585013 RepID=A0ABR3F7M4_9AGAR
MAVLIPSVKPPALICYSQQWPRRRNLQLPYDILICIFEKLEDDYRTLFRCSLLDWESNHAAMPFLYRSVVFEPTHWYGYQDRAVGEEDSLNLKSACLPHHARFVRHFEVRGYLSLNSSTRNRTVVTHMLSKAIRSFSNLRSAKFLPKSYHSSLFSGALQALAANACPYLAELTLDESCFTEGNIPTLLRVGGLRKLVIEYASQAVAKTLCLGWLNFSSGSLTTLRFEVNLLADAIYNELILEKGVCLPITADVLSSQVQYLQNLQELGLGLLDHPDDTMLCLFLESLPHLHTLSLYYNEEHLDHDAVGKPCHIPQLRSLTVRYFGPQSQSDIDRLCHWVHGLVKGSPLLEELCLIDDNGESINNLTHTAAIASFDLLIKYFTTKRSNLRSLQIPNGYLGRMSLELVCSTCSHLEDLAIATSKVFLMDFVRSSTTTRRRFSIRRAAFNLRRNRGMGDGDVLLSLAEATEVVQKFPKLQCLDVNKTAWESRSIKLDNGKTVRVIEPKTAGP